MMQASDFAQVKAVTLDGAGTLIAPHPSVGAIYCEAMAKRGVTIQPPAVEHYFRSAYKEAASQPRKHISEESERAFWKEIVRKSIGMFIDDLLFESVFAEIYATFAEGRRWRLLPGASETVAVLDGRGYRLALLSNADTRFRRVFAELGLAEHLEALFISSEIGFQKPDGRLFRHVEEKLGLSGEEILHVGDSPHHDGDGPLLAGWGSILVSEPADAPGYACVPGLDTLLDLLPEPPST